MDMTLSVYTHYDRKNREQQTAEKVRRAFCKEAVKKNLQQTALPKKPQTLVVQRIEGRKNLQHFCNKRPRNYPKIPQNTASREALFFQKKAKKKPRNHCDSKVFSWWRLLDSNQ